MIQKAWLKHLGAKPEFPRSGGTFRVNGGVHFERPTLRNTQDYLAWLRRNANNPHLYVGLYSHRQQRVGEVDKLYFDIDRGDLNTAYSDWQRFLRHLDTLEYESRSYISGSKGFAVYVDVEPTRVSWRQLRLFQKRVMEASGVTLDVSVMGEKARVSRVPFTVNAKSVGMHDELYWCVPVDRDWDLEHVLAAARREEKAATFAVTPSKALQRDLLSLPRDKVQRSQNGSQEAREASAWERAEWVANLDLVYHDWAPRLKDGRHRLLIFLVIPTLVAMGYDDASIHDYCRTLIERSGSSYGSYRDTVEFHVGRTRENGYRPWRLVSFPTHEFLA